MTGNSGPDPAPRIALFGSGQLAYALAGILPLFGEVITLGRAQADLRRPETLGAILDKVQPDIIFNAAAHTKIDQAETEPDLAMTVNGLAPAALANWARATGAKLIHFSTDYVFDGKKEGPYLETDTPNPLNVYGRSKLAGDEAIMGAGGECYIFRTSWLYSLYGHNFPKTILRLAQTRSSLEVVADQVGAPTSAEFLALAASWVVFQPRKAWGLYNLSASGAVSWHELARYLVQKALEMGQSLALKPE
ncbi:MAG: dTDP-4-dehydrorhamnose reductase, partial [Deltaproteobacteria bacterium]|nr:dTDP-4-dehydrorhamnose reductase [Deltaproteobacteria bacterium]